MQENLTEKMTDRVGNLMPHFVLVPLLAQGHIIPMVDMALLIATRGAFISFVTTPLNAARIRPTIDRVMTDGLPIRFLEFNFPPKDAGLPQGCYSLERITSNDMYVPFFEALSSFEQPLKRYLKEQSPGPICIISDSCQWWTMRVAKELNISRFIFYGPSCFSSLCVYNIQKHKVFMNIRETTETVVVPDLPHRVVTSKAENPLWFDKPGFESFYNSYLRSEEAADGFVINTFTELEPEYVRLYKQAIGRKVWPIGPLSLHNKDMTSNATRGNKDSIDEARVVDWLNTMEPQSVIFVSFGTIVHTNPTQVIEFGCGLEASSRPFIWVIKEVERSQEVDDWMLNGFLERTRKKGLILTGWAPQLVILSHPSVGGFMTHCGWNSTLEAISAGVPMITCPHFADQFLNEKLVVEVLKIGIALEVRETYSFVCGLDKVRVRREDVETAILNLMAREEEAMERRERARMFGELAQKAIEKGGSSYENLTLMMQFVMEYETNKCVMSGK